MRSHSLFQAYIWLVRTIHRARRISLEDINRLWTESAFSYGEPLARSTFNRYKDAIQDMFGLTILCDKRDGFKYYIENASVLEDDSIQNWMLSTLSVNNLLSESKGVHDRILLENIPSDGENLQMMIEAMQRNVKVEITYRKYWDDDPKTYLALPYFVKLFNKRWYAIVHHDTKDFIFPLALDRIVTMRLTDEKFSFPDDFDPKTYMKDYYGVVLDDDREVRRVVLRAYGNEAKYLRDLPLHRSQKEIDTRDTWSDFEYHIKLTSDFIAPIASRGPFLEVIEPADLREAIIYELEDTLDLYSGDQQM